MFELMDMQSQVQRSPAPLHTHTVLGDTLLPFPRSQRPAEKTLWPSQLFFHLVYKDGKRGHFLRLTSIYTPAHFPIYDLHINASQPCVSFLGLRRWGSGHRSGNEEFFFFLEELILGDYVGC